MWFSAGRQQAYGYICSYRGNGRLAIFTAMVFNSGTRGKSSGMCRRESASANEKAIWGKLAYWHQAWRQREAVRRESPNDRSLRTTAHYYNSSSLSFIHNVLYYLSQISGFFFPSTSSLALCCVLKCSSPYSPWRKLLSFFFTVLSCFFPLFPILQNSFQSSFTFLHRFISGSRPPPPPVSFFLLNN